MRIGTGFDVHRFSDAPPLLIGGVEVDTSRGLSGTSDADVLAHAISDALLGAAALGDMGMFFPSDEGEWEGADSLDLLRQVVAQIEREGHRIGNVDATVISQTVRISPFRSQIREKVAEALSVDIGCVSVKATTTDGLGLIGRDEGVAATATVLLFD